MQWELVKDINSDSWRVEALGQDGEMTVVLFSGYKAETLARAFFLVMDVF